MLLSKNVHVFSAIPFKQNTTLVFCLMPSSKSNKNVHVLSVIQDSFCLTIRKDFSFQPWASANIWKGCVIPTKLHGAEHMQTPQKLEHRKFTVEQFLCSFALGGLWPYKCFILKEQNFRNIYVYIPNIILKLFETVVWKANYAPAITKTTARYPWRNWPWETLGVKRSKVLTLYIGSECLSTSLVCLLVWVWKCWTNPPSITYFFV